MSRAGCVGHPGAPHGWVCLISLVVCTSCCSYSLANRMCLSMVGCLPTTSAPERLHSAVYNLICRCLCWYVGSRLPLCSRCHIHYAPGECLCRHVGSRLPLCSRCHIRYALAEGSSTVFISNDARQLFPCPMDPMFAFGSVYGFLVM